MANPTRPHIAFNASFMAGYNNPEITVLTIVTAGANPVIYPSYGEILALLKSGQVPLLLVTDESRQTGTLLQLAYYSTPEGVIRFSGASAQSGVAGAVVSIDFLSGKPPVIKQLILKAANN